MNSEKREMALSIWPNMPTELALAIKDEDMCYSDILQVAAKYREQIAPFFARFWPRLALNWAHSFPEDAVAMREIILKSRESLWALGWIENIGYDRDMVDMILESDNPEHVLAMVRKFATVIPAETMWKAKQVIIDSNVPSCAYRWTLYIGTGRSEMKDIIIKNRSAEYAFTWVRSFGTDYEVMKEIVAESRIAKWACFWLLDIKRDSDMIDIVFDPMADEHWKKLFRNAMPYRGTIAKGA